MGMGNLPPRFPLQFPGPHAYPGQHDLQRASMLPYGPYQSSQIFQSAGRPHDASFYHNQGVLKQRQDAEQYDSDDSSGSSQKVAREPILEISCDEIHQIRKITYEYDHHYKSISFGEELLKEMVMCSVFKIPLTSSAAMKAYRIMISRVTKVAQGFDHFLDMDHSTQAALLKENADLLVSLRGAVFFDDKKKGLDQILYSMGIDDVESGKKMIMVTLKNAGELGRIDYKNFNSLQKIEDNEVEDRYEQLLARVGSTVSLRPEIVKLFSYIILFSADFTQVNNRAQVEGVQGMLITMLKRFLLSQYSHTLAVSAFANILQTIGDLRELTHIKKKRAMAAAVTLNS